jgi:hypothetical protein
MNYKAYQIASLKHLHTCKVMLDSLDLLATNTSAQINEGHKQEALLHNMFYLSGYTLECIINYGILKHYKWKEKKSVDDTVPDHHFSSQSDLAFHRGTRTLKGGVYNFNMQGHDFQRNIMILNRALPASKIPLIDRTVRVETDLKNIFMAWQVEIRYHSSATLYADVKLTKDTIKKFVALTEKIYIDLMKKVG